MTDCRDLPNTRDNVCKCLLLLVPSAPPCFKVIYVQEITSNPLRHEFNKKIKYMVNDHFRSNCLLEMIILRLLNWPKHLYGNSENNNCQVTLWLLYVTLTWPFIVVFPNLIFTKRQCLMASHLPNLKWLWCKVHIILLGGALFCLKKKSFVHWKAGLDRNRN